MVLDGFTYVFAIGSIFALLEAYNNGASTYRQTPCFPFIPTGTWAAQTDLPQTMSPTPGPPASRPAP